MEENVTTALHFIIGQNILKYKKIYLRWCKF